MPLLIAHVAAPACLPGLFFTASLGPTGKWPPQPAGRRDSHAPGEQPIPGSPPSRDPWRPLLVPFSACSHPGLQSETRALGNMRLTGLSRDPFCLAFTLYRLPHEDSFQTEQFRKSLCGQNCSPASFQMLASPGHYSPGSRLCCYLGYNPFPPFLFLLLPLPPPPSPSLLPLLPQDQPAFLHTHSPSTSLMNHTVFRVFGFELCFPRFEKKTPTNSKIKILLSLQRNLQPSWLEKHSEKQLMPCVFFLRDGTLQEFIRCSDLSSTAPDKALEGGWCTRWGPDCIVVKEVPTTLARCPGLQFQHSPDPFQRKSPGETPSQSGRRPLPPLSARAPGDARG